MRVLLLAPAFPPHPEVGGLRAANLVHAFREAGHQVTVITLALDQPAEVPAGAGPPVHIVPVPVGPPYLVRLSRLLRRPAAAQTSRPAAGSDSAPLRPAIAPNALRRLIRAVTSIPDAENHLIGPFRRAARKAGREGVDLLYSSAPPFSIHLSARRLARELRVPWVAEFRDPWRHPESERAAGLHPLTRRVDRWLERKVLTSADTIVMVTTAARDYVRSAVPGTRADRFLVALNGVPEWTWPDPPGGAGPIRIVHAGSLYLGRDPRGFLDGLKLFVERERIAPDRLVVELIGQSREYGGASLADLVRGLGLERFVRFEGWLPHPETRRRLLAADALLLFAQRQPLQVPNKLFEYLATGRPVLAFVDPEGESARLLRELPVGRVLNDADPAGVAAALGRLFAEARNPARPRHACPEHLLTRIQMRRLVAELESRLQR